MIPETLGTDMLARAASGAALPVDTIREADGITGRGEGDPTTITNELRNAYPWGGLAFAALALAFSLLWMSSGCLWVLLPRLHLLPRPSGGSAGSFARQVHEGETHFIGFKGIVRGRVKRP